MSSVASASAGSISPRPSSMKNSWATCLWLSVVMAHPPMRKNVFICRSLMHIIGVMTTSNKSRTVRAARGAQLSAKSWLTEAPLRMLMNNLDPEVAERPEDLVVYGGIGKAARNWECFDAIVSSLKKLENEESLLIQSGKPVGVFKTHPDAPRVLIANSNLVPHW